MPADFFSGICPAFPTMVGYSSWGHPVCKIILPPTPAFAKNKGRSADGIAEKSREKLPHPVTGTGCGSHQLLFDLFTYYSRYSAESVNYSCEPFGSFGHKGRSFRAVKRLITAEGLAAVLRIRRPRHFCCQTSDYS